MDTALLLLRLVVGLYIFGHGAQKFFGWWGGKGLKATIATFDAGLGLRPAWLWTTALVSAEVVGGILMVLGLLGPLGPIAVAGAMLGATVLAHWGKGPWVSGGGFEFTLTNFAVAAAVALAGNGRYSLDAALGVQIPLVVGEVVAILAVIGVALSVATRRVPQRQPQAQTHAA